MKSYIISIVSWLTLASTEAGIPSGPSDQLHAPESVVPVIVTINAEARVSVTVANKLYRRQPCNGAIAVPITIINVGSVTALLEAHVIDGLPGVDKVSVSGGRLSGAREELRALHLPLTASGFIDITLSFRIEDDIADLGGRDRVHLLLKCL